MANFCWCWSLAAVLAFGAALDSRGADATRLAENWKFDVVHLKTGAAMQGLVVRETPDAVVFWRVNRKPGASTSVLVLTLARREIEHIDPLTAKDREALSARLRELDPTGRGEVQRMASLTLETADWGKIGKGQARLYRSEQFILISNATEDIVRRAAVRLEHLYTATARFLPPRVEAAQPTTIFLARSLTDYKNLLREAGHAELVHSAFYDVAQNRIYCGSELERLGDELEKIRKEHHQALADLLAKETELNKLYKGKVPGQLVAPIRQSRFRIAQQDDRNERAFQEATARLFRRLYHEAFHAYLANFVYPPDQGEVPRWLNEGLAQIFETAIVEAGELRIGYPDRERVRRVQELLKKEELVSLTDLLRSGPKQFLVQHGTEHQLSDRYYLTSWAVAWHLTFDRHLLGGKAMNEYVRALGRGADALEAFQAFVGKPLAEFEKEFRQRISRLPAGEAGGK
jgi:hypothetical protein